MLKYSPLRNYIIKILLDLEEIEELSLNEERIIEIELGSANLKNMEVISGRDSNVNMKKAAKERENNYQN